MGILRNTTFPLNHHGKRLELMSVDFSIRNSDLE